MREERFFDLLFEIRNWHEKTFPDATLQDQLLKLEEELSEYASAPTQAEQFKELADVFIVLAGLFRFPSIIGFHMRDKFIVNYQMRDIKSQEKILSAIKNKFEKNKARTWKRLPDGRYKHSNLED